MTKGPLAARWGEWTLGEAHAGALAVLRAELENVGTATWGGTIFLSYHWLDHRDNPIVWDGDRTPLPVVAPGEQITVEARVRAPIPPGAYRFAPDLVVEHRAWFSQLGSAASPRPRSRWGPVKGFGGSSCPSGSSRQPAGRSASPPPTPRGTASSPAASTGRAGSAGRGRRSLPPTSREAAA